MSRTPSKEVKQEKPKFSPQKSYQWQPEAEFVVRGNEIDLINKVVNAELQTPEAIRVQNMLQLRVLLNTIFSEAYEDGILTEIVEEKKEEAPSKQEEKKEESLGEAVAD